MLAIPFGGFQFDGALKAQDRLPYRHPDLVVDLGVGLWAWPLPMDWDGDGDLDLVVSCPDVPFNGTYFFENRSAKGTRFPVFEPPVKIGPGLRSPQVSYYAGQAHVLTAAQEYVDFRKNKFGKSNKIYPRSNIHASKRIRANQWKYCDYDGDGKRDLIVGVGDWADYGWDNAFDKSGKWTNGPLHGFLYLLKNQGTDAEPKYSEPEKIVADNMPIDVFGMPSPCLEDFDGDGDLDIICGEFLDGFTYFQNKGTRTKPEYSSGVRLKSNGEQLRMDLQMITPTSIDWDGDGDIDLVCGDEDGRVALLENKGVAPDGLPRFQPPRYFQQRASDLKFGALVTPVSVDWDDDGDEDLICGNTAGYIGLIENVGMVKSQTPIWARPVLLEVQGKPIRIQAGDNGSIQGPAEAKWGYTTLDVADWDHDGKLDLVVNSIWGKVVWYRNSGTKKTPELSPPQPIRVKGFEEDSPKPAWNWWTPEPGTLATQWRTTPLVYDLNRDGLNDLVMLDHEGFLAFFERSKEQDRVVLLPPTRNFKNEKGEPLRLNTKIAGGSGRRKICFADWDCDGKVDLLVNSKNIDFYRNVSKKSGEWNFRNQGVVSNKRLAGHTTSPTTVDWDRDGKPDLLIGAEDGFFYYLPNPKTQNDKN